MKLGQIVILKLYSGRLIIGTLVQSDDLYTLENPREVAIVPSMNGDVRAMNGDVRVLLCSICEPFKVERLMNRVDIVANQVFCTIEESEIEKPLLDGYKSEISGIAIATPEETASINSAR